MVLILLYCVTVLYMYDIVAIVVAVSYHSDFDIQWYLICVTVL